VLEPTLPNPTIPTLTSCMLVFMIPRRFKVPALGAERRDARAGRRPGIRP
jgi:hypothetical protein